MMVAEERGQGNGREKIERSEAEWITQSKK